MPAKRKRRRPSQKEPVGKTKSQILVYIANKGNCSMTDIRGYSRDSLNIRNQKVVRGHVAVLESEKILKKDVQVKGLADQYNIEHTFSAFRNCFNYLNKSNFSVDFLKTRFAKDVLSSDDFFFFGIVNIVKELFIEMLTVMSDESKFNGLLLEASKEGMNKQIDMMKEQRAKFIERNIPELVSGIKNKTAEELIAFAQEMFSPIKQILIGLINEMLSQDQKEEIINIISTSSSAMDYFLNLKTENRMMFLAVLMRFFIGIVFVDPSKVDIVNSFNNLTNEPDKGEALSLINELVSTKNIVNQNPILTTLKAHFIIDAISGKIIENEYSTKALTSILIPVVKQ